MKRAVLIVLAALLLTGCGLGAVESEPASELVNPTPAPGVFLGGWFYHPSVKTLDLTGRDVTAAELLPALPEFENLERVELRDLVLTAEERESLSAAAPTVTFSWPVEVLGRRFLSTDRELSFAGVTLRATDTAKISAALADFPELRTVDLTGCGLAEEQLLSLAEKLGDVQLRWDVTVYGKEFSSLDEEIDLSGITVTDGGEEIEKKLACFPNLSKVVMCECGIPDEEMDALNNRHEDVRFVWLVNVHWAAIRTDSDFFIPYRAAGVKQTGMLAGLRALRYCPDLVALDIGHSGTQDLSYLAVMPHLKYLIIADNYVTDITEVGKLTELRWLEMFQCMTRDISPLLNCRELTDLNICYVLTPGDNLYETLRQMTWLKRLWCSGTNMTKKQVESLREELPDTEIWCRTGDESTGSTWRYSESYYEMRDAFHMYYMNITGDRTERLDEEQLAAMHRRFWGY